MVLTDAALRKAKPAAKPVKLADSGGLYLLLNPNGSRWWRWDYRRPVTAKRNTLSLGTYPDVGLAQVRQRRDDARKLLANGIDPGQHRKAEKAAGEQRAGNSFEVVAREWLAKQTWAANYLSKVTALFENDVFPSLGSRPVSELTAPEFLKVARRVEARGAVETAHRAMQNCGQVVRYAIATGRADRNPVADLKGALAQPEEKHFAAIVDVKLVGGLLRAIDGYVGTPEVRAALQLAPLVFVRPGELRCAEWIEFDLDAIDADKQAAAVWNIPAHRMKLRQPHLVPLSPQAVAILRDLHMITGRGRYVFPGGRSPRRPMSNNAVNAALRRMGYDSATMTGHGFRAMARTILDEVLGIRPDYIEHQLAHAVRDPNGRAYNRTAHLVERRKMMDAWAKYLDGLKIEGT